jgi:uncharacterized membrane protein
MVSAAPDPTPPAPTARHVHGIDLARVEAAIHAAEQLTSGEIRVAISRFYFWGDVRRAAESAFARLHMDRTRRRNGVLLFVAPRLHRFAVLGDIGIHRHVTPAFWNDLAEDLAAAFRGGDLTGGLERAIGAIGQRLARHFPPDAAGANELPDNVVV